MASTASNFPTSGTSSSFSSPSSPSSNSGVAGAPPASVSVGEDLLSSGHEPRQSQAGDGSAAQAQAQGRDRPEALDRWVERLHAGIDRLAEAAVPRLQRLQSGMNATRGTLRRQADLVREDGEEWAESLRCTVREHPVTAVAVAAAFGMLLARLSR
ncbi:hypothetical protein ACS5PK_01500 [Roseateles sp. DB2]|uniref:hypothetical protein n=1 Tax=Roseateles sp. DB2 TaxID=3453717 RepID=UPI003EEAA72C